MELFKHEDLDQEILGDLLEEINELYEASEQTLIELELQPEDNELQRALFRSIHTIKGDLGLVNFTPMIPLLQHIETLLDYLRKGQVRYTSNMSDLVLMSMDHVKIFVQSCIKVGQAEYDAVLYQALVKHIVKITPDNADQHERLLGECVRLMDPTRVVEGLENAAASGQSPTPKKSVTLANTGIPKDLSAEKQIDVLFFRELIKPIEKRSMYWTGRGDRIAKLAYYVNKMAGSPIDEDQLAVASYVHDFGMAFMPLHVLHKREQLTDAEFNLMRSHVYKSGRLLEHLDQWNEARKIVMQHHERLDGTGYPMGLMEKDICEGAKLLAILDTYEALTHSRSQKGHVKHPKRKAVVELNKIPPGQLCPKWLQIFNRAMASLLK